MLQDGEAIDYSWTRMKTHKNQLRVKNAQVSPGFSIYLIKLQCPSILQCPSVCPGNEQFCLFSTIQMSFLNSTLVSPQQYNCLSQTIQVPLEKRTPICSIECVLPVLVSENWTFLQLSFLFPFNKHLVPWYFQYLLSSQNKIIKNTLPPLMVSPIFATAGFAGLKQICEELL